MRATSDSTQRWPQYVAIVAGCVGIALVVAYSLAPLKTVTYQSAARILLVSDASVFEPTPDSGRGEQAALQRVLSDDVRIEGESQLGFAATIVAEVEAQDLLAVRAFEADPERARKVAQAFAEAYLTVQDRDWASELDGMVEDVTKRIADLDAEISALDPGDEFRRLVALRDNLADSRDRLEVTRQLGPDQSARIIDGAQLIAEPFSEEPRTRDNLLIGGLIGLVAGAIVVAAAVATQTRTGRS